MLCQDLTIFHRVLLFVAAAVAVAAVAVAVTVALTVANKNVGMKKKKRCYCMVVTEAMTRAFAGLRVIAVLFVAASSSSMFVFVLLAASLMNVELHSEGCDDPGKTGCGRALIKVNNEDYSLHKRGFNVAVFTEQGMRSP